jgi:Flp pilus assembly protein TadG
MKRKRNAAVAVEMAMISPILVIFLIGLSDVILCGMAQSQASLAAQSAAAYHQKYHHATDDDMVSAAQSVHGVSAVVVTGNYANGNASKTITCSAPTYAIIPVSGFAFPSTVSSTFTYPE